jgi:hypothetical protein
MMRAVRASISAHWWQRDARKTEGLCANGQRDIQTDGMAPKGKKFLGGWGSGSHLHRSGAFARVFMRFAAHVQTFTAI